MTRPTPLEVCRRNRILDRFCGNKMTYEPIYGLQWDAMLYNDKDKWIGIAKIVSNPGNFASKPIVEISTEAIDFINELGLFLRKAPAIIVKFRNKIAYWKPNSNTIKTLKIKDVITTPVRKVRYLVPVNLFTIVT